MQNPLPLSYQPPTSAEAESVVWDKDRLRIELGPMSNWELLAAVFPATLWLGVAAGFTGLVFAARTQVPCFYIVIVVTALSAGISLARSIRHRRLPRIVWVCPTSLAYSDCRTGGAAVLTRYSAALTKARVTRPWRRPWVCELWVRPIIPNFRMGRSDPVILAIATNRRRLERLLPVIEWARIPAQSAHVHGAFEVIPIPT